MPFGLLDDQITLINSTLSTNSNLEEIIIFGSRAKGNHHSGSDIDLALKGKKLCFDDLLVFINKLDDLQLPYSFDLLLYEKITDKDLLDHIERIGKFFYKR